MMADVLQIFGDIEGEPRFDTPPDRVIGGVGEGTTSLQRWHLPPEVSLFRDNVNVEITTDLGT